MKGNQPKTRTKAQISTKAIERLYITMEHLFYRGHYKPMGMSGDTLAEALLELQPEIYGSIAEECTELNGLLYVKERLPQGIEECQYINITSKEGYAESHFDVIVPPKRKRNSYRIDQEQMNIEVTRSKSDIYDILTHLTFVFIESHKLRKKVWDEDQQQLSHDWQKVSAIVTSDGGISEKEKETALSLLSPILGRTFHEMLAVYDAYAVPDNTDYFLHFIYYLGKTAIDEVAVHRLREIRFSTLLQERLGHHIYSEQWANDVKAVLLEKNLMHRPLHIISANMHSVMNTLFAKTALQNQVERANEEFKIYDLLSESQNKDLRNTVHQFAENNGMTYIKDQSGATINVQIFDTAQIDFSLTDFADFRPKSVDAPVIMVMDYAFGEQAYSAMDELLKPYFSTQGERYLLNVDSISIMGKAGILAGNKGDLMIATSHINEGTADNYPFKNELKVSDFENCGLQVFEGSMVTVLGTSLQNKDLLQFFMESTWQSIGLEMEGAHYQKAIQAASKIRKSIQENVKLRYAYYASDNPLKTGSTLASGGLGLTGVKPTYLITQKILDQILER